MITSLKKTVAAAAVVLAAAGPAHATLIGDTVGCTITPTPFWVCSSPTAVVGAGVEFQLDIPSASSSFGFGVDLGASSVRIENIEDNIFSLGVAELLTLTSLDAGAPIIGIANLSISGVSVLSASSITWTADSLQIDLDHGATWNVGSFVSFDLVLGPANRVPEPGSMALVAFALAGLGWSRRRATR